MSEAILQERPYKVTAEDGRVKLLIVDYADGVPAAFALMGTQAWKKVAIRIGGGCKNMTMEDKLGMVEFFRKAFRGYKGVVWSGATRAVTPDGRIDPMVTEIPGVIAADNPGAVALGTAPRVDILSLQGDSHLILDQYGTIPNVSQKGVLIVQNGADGKLDWNGDLDMYFKIMAMWRDHAGFTALALITWNGGAVTEEEIMKAVNLHWPVILIEGSGRVTDEIAKKLKENDEETKKKLGNGDNVIVVSKDEPENLRLALIQCGFLN